MDGLCLTPPPDLCCVSLQARMAGERGASAVLFDITEDRAAAEQVPWMRGAWGVGGAEGGREGRERCCGSRSQDTATLVGTSSPAAAAALGADVARGVDLGSRCREADGVCVQEPKGARED